MIDAGFSDMFPLGTDTTPYRKVSGGGIAVDTFPWRQNSSRSIQAL